MPNVFSPDQVLALERYQRSGRFHPFTCENRSDGNHRENDVDLGALVPTIRGWICPYCNYTQTRPYAMERIPHREDMPNTVNAG